MLEATLSNSAQAHSSYAHPILYLQIKYNRNSGENCIVLTLVTLTSNVNAARTLNAEWSMKDSCSGENCLCELDLNINLYLTLNYVTASQHLKHSARKLYGVL